MRSACESSGRMHESVARQELLRDCAARRAQHARMPQHAASRKNAPWKLRTPKPRTSSHPGRARACCASTRTASWRARGHGRERKRKTRMSSSTAGSGCVCERDGRGQCGGVEKRNGVVSTKEGRTGRCSRPESCPLRRRLARTARSRPRHRHRILRGCRRGRAARP